MIAYLRGRVLEKRPGRVVVDVGGVGYDVLVPLSTYYDIGDAGQEIALRVHTHVREDVFQLYGFFTVLEQEVFELLITISGVGPKLASAVLSGIEPRELITAIQRADVTRLVRVPGIGKKTAERLVLELKDRTSTLTPVGTAEESSAPADTRLRDDLLSALQNLGYHRPLAEKAIDTVLSVAGEPPSLQHALRGALRELMRG